MTSWGLFNDIDDDDEEGDPGKKKVETGTKSEKKRKKKEKNTSTSVPSAAGAKAKLKSKKTGGGQPNPPRYKDLLGQTLENSRNIAYLMCISFYSLLLAKNTDWVEKSQKVGKIYSTRTKVRENHGLWSPHLRIFDAWIQVGMKHDHCTEEEK